MTVQRYRALTWDHPRGYNALAAAAAALDPARDALAIAWDKQPLEGFESHPIADLCSRYDLVVLDHPHVGEAVEAGCLQPLEEVFEPQYIADLAAATIGPCLSSYRYAGQALGAAARRGDAGDGGAQRPAARCAAARDMGRGRRAVEGIRQGRAVAGRAACGAVLPLDRGRARRTARRARSRPARLARYGQARL